MGCSLARLLDDGHAVLLLAGFLLGLLVDLGVHTLAPDQPTRTGLEHRQAGYGRREVGSVLGSVRHSAALMRDVP